MIKTIFSTSVIAISFGLAGLSLHASAACGGDTASSWECLRINNGDMTDQGLQGFNGAKSSGALPLLYLGVLEFSYSPFGAWTCYLMAEGYAEVDTSGGSSAHIEVTALTSFGIPDCMQITFPGVSLASPLEFDIPGSDDLYPKYSDQLTSTSNAALDVDVFGMAACQGYVSLDLYNDGTGGSSLRFDETIPSWLGSCTITATLTNAFTEAY